MNPQTSKMLMGAVVAAALAIAVYYGLISQQTASGIQTQANQTLGTGPANQQQPGPVPQNQMTPAPAPHASSVPQNSAQPPR